MPLPACLAYCREETSRDVSGPFTRRRATTRRRRTGIRTLGSAKLGWQNSRMEMIERHVRPSLRSEEHTSELQSLMRISYAVFCLKKKIIHKNINARHNP